VFTCKSQHKKAAYSRRKWGGGLKFRWEGKTFISSLSGRNAETASQSDKIESLHPTVGISTFLKQKNHIKQLHHQISVSGLKLLHIIKRHKKCHFL
jgi:hypothetical protein